MKTDRLIQVLSIGANVAVLAGLVFLGLQVRDGRSAAEAQAVDGVAEGFLEINALAVADPSIACMWSVGLMAPNRLSDLQAAQFSMMLLMDFNQYLRVFGLYKTGLVSEEYWGFAAASAAWKMSTPGGREFFSENSPPGDFVDAVSKYADSYHPNDFMLGRELPESCPS